MTKKNAPRPYTLILTIGVGALVLLSLAWPRLRASFSYLPVDTAISNYWKDRTMDQQQLTGLIARARESNGLHDHYRYWEGLSELQMLSAQDPEKSFWQRRQALEQTILAAEEVVSRAPAKPRTWLRIARVKAYLQYPDEQVTVALKMSILTGRVEPTLMITRLELGLNYLARLDTEAVLLIRDQVVLTWSLHRNLMLSQMKSGALDFKLIHDLLSGYNDSFLAELGAGLDE
jgi:hypothetical protein